MKLEAWTGYLAVTSILSFAIVLASAAPGVAGAAPATLKCDDSMKTAFKPDANTTVLQVKQMRKGDLHPHLTAAQRSLPNPPTLSADLCWVKLLVGPGIPGPAGAPSTSPGIGIEVWLPEKSVWIHRIHAMGTPGWSTGGPEGSLKDRPSYVLAGLTAADEHAVTSTTDSGLPNSDVITGSFALNPDRSVNVAGWRNWTYRGLYEQAVMTKALTAAYYGSPARYSYFTGGSGGGRQALHIAQNLPEQYDGINANSPGPDWSSFIAEVYPALVGMRDLGGEDPVAQMDLASRAAVAACDMVGGKHLGFILDIRRCRYDPTRDRAVLCTAAGGTNTTPACLNHKQALAMNKIWYGMTVDGSVPDPAVDNGFDYPLTGKHLWYGFPRGGIIISLYGSWGGGPLVGRDVVGIALRDPKLAATGDPKLGLPGFKNATGDGEDGWKNLSYEQLAGAYETFKALDAELGINSNNPDLTRLRNAGTKLLHVTGVHDGSVWLQGHTDYYDKVVARMGGLAGVKDYYRLYVVPAMFHGDFSGSANREVNPPIVGPDQAYQALVNWVEKGIPPDMVFHSPPSGAKPMLPGYPPAIGPEMSLPACAYPAIATYVSGDIHEASSYKCD
jgi:feruloyl esterase